jgi:hypothetical protein
MWGAEGQATMIRPGGTTTAADVVWAWRESGQQRTVVRADEETASREGGMVLADDGVGRPDGIRSGRLRVDDITSRPRGGAERVATGWRGRAPTTVDEGCP